MIQERRKNRSDAVHESARLYLEGLVRRDCLKAVALATEDGFLVAGAGGEYDLDWLAALGSVCGSQVGVSDALQTLIAQVTHGDRFYTAALRVQGETFYLVSVGARVPRQMEATAALERIFGPALAPVV